MPFRATFVAIFEAFLLFIRWGSWKGSSRKPPCTILNRNPLCPGPNRLRRPVAATPNHKMLWCWIKIQSYPYPRTARVFYAVAAWNAAASR